MKHALADATAPVVRLRGVRKTYRLGAHVIPGMHHLIGATIGIQNSWYLQFVLPTAADRQRITALRRELRQADVVVGNLEGVLSDTGASRKDARKPGLYTFRMPTSYALTLRDMGFDVMSLANNHSMDFGAQGLASTLAALRANGIAPMGVPGAEVATVTVRRTRVAFLNYSYLPAFVRMDDARRITADIGHARRPAPFPALSQTGPCRPPWRASGPGSGRPAWSCPAG